MYLYRQDAEKLLRNSISRLATDLLEKNDVLGELLKQNDWSFVIKTHALLEAAVTQLLIEAVGNDRLGTFMERLPLGAQFGKLRVCEHLALLSQSHLKFIRWFSDFRNPLVHRLENVNFTFARHLRHMTLAQKRSWQEAIVWFSDDDSKVKNTWKEIAIKAPKQALYMALYLVTGECIIQSHGFRAKKAVHETSERTMKETTPPYQGPPLQTAIELQNILQHALDETNRTPQQKTPTRKTGKSGPV